VPVPSFRLESKTPATGGQPSDPAVRARDYNRTQAWRASQKPEDDDIKRYLIWMIPLVLIVLLVGPTPVAERYTSPTQDGQFLAHPIRSYGFIVTLARASGSAALSNPGHALAQAKRVFSGYDSPPVKVSLLYLSGRDNYEYVTRAGETLSIAAPPRLVWEIWGRASNPSSAQTNTPDVIGFLDYASGDEIGTTDATPYPTTDGTTGELQGRPQTVGFPTSSS
jgi:hypothetical protein